LTNQFFADTSKPIEFCLVVVYFKYFILGKGGELVDSGNNTYGGKYVINPSGGLISKGHPLGATGAVHDNNVEI
jgi:hypothetical protein